MLLWKAAGVGAAALKLGSAERHADRKVREAERTWVAGAEAEREVGRALEDLRAHGFYLLHDVELARLGNVDHVAFGPSGLFAVETKSHRGRVSAQGGKLLVNGKSPEKDFISQTWRGAYRLREITGSETRPVLCFTRAFVEGPALVRGVRVVPVRRLAKVLLSGEGRLPFREVSKAVSALGAAAGCYPSAVPRR